MKKFIDQFLDFIENYVLGTKSKLDDDIVLPICEMLRKTMGIPDDDANIGKPEGKQELKE